MKILRRGLLVGFAAVLLAGCGFQLQGTAKLPAGIHTIYVATTDELSPFAVELDRALRDAGAQLLAVPDGADVVVRISQDKTGRRVLSVSTRNTPQEYQVYYTLQYSIDRGKERVVQQQDIELSRSYSYSEPDALAKDREEAILREAMARDLADLVIRRLASL